MMRRTLLLFLFLPMCLYGWSQLSMTLQVPPTGVLVKPQLWNIAFVNSSTAGEIEIDLVLTNIRTGEVALTATTNPILITNGAQQITSSNITVQYDYPSALISDHSPDGFLAIGTFNACYTVHGDIVGGKSGALNECTDIVVEPVSPPTLTIPCNGCYAESATPLFTWLPAAPINLFTNLTYEMKLVEVLPGQASSEAIQINAPVLLQDGNTNSFFNYPTSGTWLDTTKTYAWQVIAKSANEDASQSEIWTFKLKSDSVVLDPISKNPYVRLKQSISSAATFCDGNLNFQYRNEASDSTVSFTVYSLSDNSLYATVKTGILTLKEGDNYLSILLFDDKRFVSGDSYLLELINSEGEKWKMKFILQLPE